MIDSNELNSYVRSCHDLSAEIAKAINDLDFVYKQGGRIVYAVDFSEIFSFTSPMRTHKEFCFLFSVSTPVSL